MLELRKVMEPYVAFSNNAILEGAAPWERSLEGQTWATIPMKTQPDPTKKVAPAEEPTEEAAPTEVSAKETDPTEVSAEETATHRGAH